MAVVYWRRRKVKEALAGSALVEVALTKALKKKGLSLTNRTTCISGHKSTWGYRLLNVLNVIHSLFFRVICLRITHSRDSGKRSRVRR
jgi:hypothetical protein